MTPAAGVAGIVSVTAMIGLSACVDFPSPAVNPACSTEVNLGAFFGRAAGASTDSLAGCGYFTTDTVTLAFAMVLTNGGPLTNAPMVKLFRARRPAAGQIYTIGVGTMPMTGVMLLGTQSFTITSGTFRTKADDRSSSIYAQSYFLEGDVDLTATDTLGATLNVKGSFNAICVSMSQDPTTSTDPFKKKSKSCDPLYAGLRRAP